MAAHIRYLAIVSEHPDKVAQFYAKYFSMRELGHGENGDVALTDGFYNISVLKPRKDEALGISHFGIEIDDIHQVESRLKEFAPSADIEQEAGDLFHGDYRVTDPSGYAVSLSTKGFSAPTTERAFPCIRHIAVCMPVPAQAKFFDFYTNVFGFRESTTSKKVRADGRSAYWVADGETAVAILRSHKGRDDDPTETSKDGLNHFGWLVNNIQGFLGTLPEGCLSKRPDDRPMAEYRGFDPDRNPFDISQETGYEVDVDRWVRG